MSSKGFADIYGIYFDFGSADIKEESMPVLAEIVSCLNENPMLKLLLKDIPTM